MSDTVLGVQYEGGVVLACDQNNGRSILVYQKNLDKIVPLTEKSALAVSGPNCDAVNFTELMARNFALFELRNDGHPLSTHAQANFCRSSLAKALRKGPYQVNVLLGGYDDDAADGEGQASLYFMDYIGALQKVPYGAQGYAQYFCLGTMDREYRPNLDEAAAIKMVEKCIHELQTRFLLSQDHFLIKIVDRDGIRIHKFDQDPADT